MTRGMTAAARPDTADGTGGENDELTAVACGPAGPCAATGYAGTQDRQTVGLITVGAGSSWKSLQAPLPADSAGHHQTEHSVSPSQLRAPIQLQIDVERVNGRGSARPLG